MRVLQAPNTALPVGLLLSMVLAAFAWLGAVQGGLAAWGLGLLPLAMFLGMALGNAAPTLAQHGHAGFGFARRHVMRTGIALFGFQLGFADLLAVG
ncbi:MAG: putative sulfate exporter family transporter, partial [Gammaproteobacteria bacterium]